MSRLDFNATLGFLQGWLHQPAVIHVDSRLEVMSGAGHWPQTTRSPQSI